jgi:hypothetical protein
MPKSLFVFKREFSMNFKSLCEEYVDRLSINRGEALPMARRRIWPSGITLMMGAYSSGEVTPSALVNRDFGGSSSEVVKIGLSLCFHEEIVIYGWSPPIDDVLGQDWEWAPRR